MLIKHQCGRYRGPIHSSSTTKSSTQTLHFQYRTAEYVVVVPPACIYRRHSLHESSNEFGAPVCHQEDDQPSSLTHSQKHQQQQFHHNCVATQSFFGRTWSAQQQLNLTAGLGDVFGKNSSQRVAPASAMGGSAASLQPTRPRCSRGKAYSRTCRSFADFVQPA
jgi:hypothetical protein